MSFRSWLSERFPKKSLGQRGEDAAARFLKQQGYTVLARSLDSRLGELDIVAIDGRTIVFVEVKTRTSDEKGHPTEAIDPRKQQRMTQAALAYLKAQRLLDYPARFDAVAITWPDTARRPTIEHYPNAFTPAGLGQFFS
jgi:putative endonuclease